jgi:tetratricopeptide (TPR) repeat protein
LKDDSHRSRLEDAKEKVRKAIDALKLRVDADHPDLVERRMLLANLLVQTNEPSSLQEAVELLRQVVPASSGRYGPEHPWTQEATMNLVFVLEELGKTKEAEEWQQRIVQLENEAETTAQDLLRQFVLISCHGHRLELLQLAMKVIALLAIKGVTVISFLVDVLYRTQRKWQCLARVDEDAAEGPDDLAWVQDVLQHKQQMIWARYRAVGSSNRSASQACSAQANGESSDAPVASSAAAASQVSNRSCLCPPSCESTDGASSDSWAEWKAAHQEMARTRTQAS